MRRSLAPTPRRSATPSLQLSLAREQSLRALETLIGRYPSATVDIATELAKWPGPVPAGLPSELLERRPDVIAADRRIAAAFLRTEEAKAARLPTIKLTGIGHRPHERAVRAAGSRQSGLERRWQPVRAAVHRRRAQDAGPDPHGRAAPGDRGLRPDRRPRVRRGRERARRRVRGRPARAGAHPSGCRESAGARAGADSLTTSAPAICGASGSSSSPCTAREPRSCACRPSGSCSGSTSTSRSAAGSTRLPLPSHAQRRARDVLAAGPAACPSRDRFLPRTRPRLPDRAGSRSAVSRSAP